MQAWVELDKLKPALQELGRRHVAYGIEPAHYRFFGDALIWALGKRLGSDFTPSIKEAWVDAYADLADAMIDASHNGADHVADRWGAGSAADREGND